MKTPKSSKKMTQVAVASALGLALLAGGSTYALWSATATADTEATIATGDLALTASAVQGWSDVTNEDTPVAIDDINEYRLAPGSSVQLKQDITAVVVGDNIKGDFKVTLPKSGSNAAILAQSVVTVDVLDSTGTPVANQAVSGDASSVVNTIAELPKTESAGDVYTVVITVELPSTADNDTKLQTLTLSDLVVTLDQVL